jgi:hypothetical protein
MLPRPLAIKFPFHPTNTWQTGRTSRIFGPPGLLQLWLASFVMMMAFYSAETEGKPGKSIHFDIPGYEDDFSRMGILLGRV